MTDEAEIQRVVAAHRERWGRLDVLVNNAGVGFGAGVADQPTKRIDMQLDLNLRAVILFYRECADLLRAAGAEHRNALVVNTSSLSGKAGQAWLNVYSATKAAVIGWTQAMNKELNAEGIKSLALCPGFVDTPMTEFVREHVPPRGDDPDRRHRGGGAVRPAHLPVLRRPRDHLPAAGRARPVKLGIHIGYWGLGLDAAQQLALVQEGERLGYDSAWTAEAYGSDAVTILAWLAGQTERIKLGSAVLQMPGRSAAMTAMTAATLDQLSGGRLLLGLGTSGPQVAEGWHGQRFGRQLQRTREYVEVVRMALRRERVVFKGETLELPLPDGPGKALKLTIAPVQERMPIYIAAIGPKNTTLAAEIGDGWIPTLFSPEHVAEFRPLLEDGFARAGGGKGFADFDIAPTVSTFVGDDRDAARDAMRHYLALYVGGMGSREQNFYNALVRRYGFEDAAQRVQDLYLDGKKDEAAAALPGELIDAVSLCGPPDVVRERIALFREAGVGTLIVSPMAWSFEDRLRQLQLVAELAG